MRRQLPPSFVHLTQDALLKAFWRKNTLRNFLQQHGISGALLAPLYADQTKREYLDSLWSRLVVSTAGQGAILDIARSLAEMRDFPDLERLEDSSERIPAAKLAVSRLKEGLASINAAAQRTRESQAWRQAAQRVAERRLASEEALAKLDQRLQELCSELGTQQGGYEFERWIYGLAAHYEIPARPAYVADGRQIDGAMTIEGTTYLVETKFTLKPVESPDVDVFVAKVTRMADNTMGLFVSMSGFTAGAVSSASMPKTPVLLLDHTHICGLVLRGIMPLPDVVSRVRRHASQTCRAYLLVEDF